MPGRREDPVARNGEAEPCHEQGQGGRYGAVRQVSGLESEQCRHPLVQGEAPVYHHRRKDGEGEAYQRDVSGAGLFAAQCARQHRHGDEGHDD